MHFRHHIPLALLLFCSLTLSFARASSPCDGAKAGERCVSTSSCAENLRCERRKEKNKFRGICRSMPQEGEPCYVHNSLDDDTSIPVCAQHLFCSFAKICTNYPDEGQVCLPARWGFGLCRPNMTCVDLGGGSTECRA